MNQRDVMFLVGGSLLVWFFMRNRAAASVEVVNPGQQSDMNQPQGMPVLVNQQQYYNISFSNDQNNFTPLSTEYMPLFGFIATRSYF